MTEQTKSISRFDLEGKPRRIGDLLMEYTSLKKSQLEEALAIQQETGQLLGEILLEKEYITPNDITRVICKQMGIPYRLDLGVEQINPQVINDIPINYCKHHNALPIEETVDTVFVAVADPLNDRINNDLGEIFKKQIQFVVSAPAKIQDAINRVYEKANKDIIQDIKDEFEENIDLDAPIDILDSAADEAPVIRFVNSIIFRSVKERASDIHIEPYEKETVYRFRINGVMQEIMRQPKKTHAAVSSRIKVMAKLDIAEKRLPQDGRIKIKIAGKDVDIRLSTTPVQNGERIVMRILEKDNTVLELEKLGFHGNVLEGLQDISSRKHGILYVTGPTGHGKTTTLFAVLDHINTPDKMIITVEDPVEYEIQGISQIQVNHKIDLSFAVALRSILRQNPDVVMVGETRDIETAEMAINASLTGHFVLSTLHTNDSASAPTRLIDMGVQPFLISSSLVGVLAQRLIQTLCPECKKPAEITPYELNLLGVMKIPEEATIYKAHGCDKCSGRGYKGRTVVSELLLINDEIRQLILKKEDSGKIKRAAVKSGMITMRQDALHKVYRGITSIEEMARAINVEENIEAA